MAQLPAVPHFRKIETLTRDNFYLWKSQLRAVLTIHNLEKYTISNPAATASFQDILDANKRHV